MKHIEQAAKKRIESSSKLQEVLDMIKWPRNTSINNATEATLYGDPNAGNDADGDSLKLLKKVKGLRMTPVAVSYGYDQFKCTLNGEIFYVSFDEDGVGILSLKQLKG